MKFNRHCHRLISNFSLPKIPGLTIIVLDSRLLTLFRMKKRFRDVFGTAVILIPRLTSAINVLLLIYYFFAIIGMDCSLRYSCSAAISTMRFPFPGPSPPG